MSNSNEIESYKDIVESFDNFLEKSDHYFKHSGPDNIIDTIMKEWKETTNDFLTNKAKELFLNYRIQYHFAPEETKPSPKSGKNVKIIPKK